MDQPERRAANYLMLGSGRFSPIYSASCNYNAIADTNVVLAEHPAGTVELMDDIIFCPQCLDWNESADSDMALFSPPPNYP
jgi:hypothetical protein